ncbi:ras-related protein Rab-37 isoform X1 [Alligator sinensis]|uniref:small monomeric GTPase n=2 Tax=Alligator sinensis TaxID=38654 RepID=A0A3Q0GA08_ALLSI|nr:ras-related protein Rab-37 isoform X1 [Alligator sinensis]
MQSHGPCRTGQLPLPPGRLLPCCVEGCLHLLVYREAGPVGTWCQPGTSAWKTGKINVSTLCLLCPNAPTLPSLSQHGICAGCDVPREAEVASTPIVWVQVRVRETDAKILNETKVMLLGDSGVGKTCFLVQFKDGAFLSGTFIATVGIDFRNKVVTVDDVKVKLQIWDTAGQERFRSVTHAYYRDAQALLLLYDITSKMSFDNIRAWLSEIHEYAQKDVVIMLLGNKADVSSERVVRTEDGETLAREYGVPFMETSAKTGMNVELAFLAIAKELKERAVQQLDEPRFQIHDYIESQKKKSSCCAFI